MGRWHPRDGDAAEARRQDQTGEGPARAPTTDGDDVSGRWRLLHRESRSCVRRTDPETEQRDGTTRRNNATERDAQREGGQRTACVRA